MPEFSSVTLEAEHVPEVSRTLESDHTITEQELPGMVNVYLVIDGARLLFTQYKAGKVFDAIAVFKQQQEADAPSQPQTPTEQPPTEQPTEQPPTEQPPPPPDQV